MAGRRRRTTTVAPRLAILGAWLALLGRIARRAPLRRVAHLLLLLLPLRWVARRAGVDGRQRARGPTVLLLLLRGAQAARGRVRVRGRAAEGVLVLGVHGERGAAGVLRRQRRRARRVVGGGRMGRGRGRGRGVVRGTLALRAH